MLSPTLVAEVSGNGGGLGGGGGEIVSDAVSHEVTFPQSSTARTRNV